MKKILNIATVVILFTCGCTKLIKDDGAGIDTSGYTLLKAAIENLTLPGYDPSVALWSKDDQVGLFAEGQSRAVCWDVRVSSDGKRDAEFYGPLVKGDKIIGVFPYDSSVEYNGGAITCELPGVQKHLPDLSMTEFFLTYNPYVFGVADNGAIDLRYAYGLLEIDFDLAYPVEIARLSISSDTQFISGRMRYDCENLSGTGASSKTIILDLEGKTYMSTELKAYAVIRPGVYEDLSVTIGLADGGELTLNVPQTSIERISSGCFTAGHVTVSSSDLPSLDQEDGYWEEEK